MDRWHGMTMDDIRRLEDKTKVELDQVLSSHILFKFVRHWKTNLDTQPLKELKLTFSPLFQSHEILSSSHCLLNHVQYMYYVYYLCTVNNQIILCSAKKGWWGAGDKEWVSLESYVLQWVRRLQQLWHDIVIFSLTPPHLLSCLSHQTHLNPYTQENGFLNFISIKAQNKRRS